MYGTRFKENVFWGLETYNLHSKFEPVKWSILVFNHTFTSEQTLIDVHYLDFISSLVVERWGSELFNKALLRLIGG